MQRNQSLDALRGFAILAMVLSGSIAFGILPAWMYHAQVPPPKHVFDPSLPGITWVDLVFPFFLFSMGAAIPLACNKMLKEDAGFLKIIYTAFRRLLLLTFFALFTVHMRAASMAEHPGANEQLLSIGGFILLFFQLYHPSEKKFEKVFTACRFLAFIIAAGLLYWLPFRDGNGFSFNRSDVIIIVLANMAFFGTIIWWFTRKNSWIRIGILPFIMAVFLGSSEAGSWNASLFNWSPLPWMYKFYYLKYLFIIIPGTLAGDWLLQYGKDDKAPESRDLYHLLVAALLSLSIVVINVILLFSRYTFTDFIITALLCTAVYYFIKKSRKELLLYFSMAGTYLLLLGLFFDAYEGGIKKDYSTYSYYFVSAGLAFFMLIGFYSMPFTKAGKAVTDYLSLNGRNPMVAYVAGNLLLLPLLHLTGLITDFSRMDNNVWTGVLKGVLFTAIVSLITVVFTKRRWQWKT